MEKEAEEDILGVRSRIGARRRERRSTLEQARRSRQAGRRSRQAETNQGIETGDRPVLCAVEHEQFQQRSNARQVAQAFGAGLIRDSERRRNPAAFDGWLQRSREAGAPVARDENPELARSGCDELFDRVVDKVAKRIRKTDQIPAIARLMLLLGLTAPKRSRLPVSARACDASLISRLALGER